jgi:hypothetical protein
LILTTKKYRSKYFIFFKLYFTFHKGRENPKGHTFTMISTSLQVVEII